MKKLLLMLFLTMMSVSFSLAQGRVNPISSADFEKSYQSSGENQETDVLIAYDSSTLYEVLVYASNTVDNLCNYFNDSWADVALTWYCKLGGDVYTCTAYKLVTAACGMNGVVRLMIEGDYNAALKRALKTSAKVFNVKYEDGSFVLY